MFEHPGVGYSNDNSSLPEKNLLRLALILLDASLFRKTAVQPFVHKVMLAISSWWFVLNHGVLLSHAAAAA